MNFNDIMSDFGAAIANLELILPEIYRLSAEFRDANSRIQPVLKSVNSHEYEKIKKMDAISHKAMERGATNFYFEFKYYLYQLFAMAENILDIEMLHETCADITSSFSMLEYNVSNFIEADRLYYVDMGMGHVFNIVDRCNIYLHDIDCIISAILRETA